MAFSINQMTDGSKLLADAVKAVQDKSSARRLLEDKVLADNGLGSKKQLFAENLARFEAIVDALVENKEVSTTIIFNADSMLTETAKDARFSQRRQQIVVNEGVISDVTASHVRPAAAKIGAGVREVKRKITHALSKPGSREHTRSHPNAMGNPGHNPRKHSYEGVPFTHEVHLKHPMDDHPSIHRVVSGSALDAARQAKHDRNSMADDAHDAKIVKIKKLHEDGDFSVLKSEHLAEINESVQ